MTCCQLAEHLMAFLDGDLDDDRKRQLEEHLRECPPCVVYIETYRLTVHLSRCLPCAELPEHLRRRCEEIVRQEGGGGCGSAHV